MLFLNLRLQPKEISKKIKEARAKPNLVLLVFFHHMSVKCLKIRASFEMVLLSVERQLGLKNRGH